MLRVGLVGLGFMGTGHFNAYAELEKNGVAVKLVAICDIDTDKLESGKGTAGNLNIGGTDIDLSGYNTYKDMREMIAAEGLDYVDLCLPTYLHGPMAIEAMELGVHVFCEKPMSISSEMCAKMIEAAERTAKKLMIGHTLRYWNVYEYAKECIEDERYGAVVSAYLFRGGSTPLWSYRNWLLNKEKSGGCLLDQHVHDVDAINWLFGVPDAVSSIGKVVFDGSGYDAVSTNYIYSDRKVVNAQDDWTINGAGFMFRMLYRINFEKGALVYEDGVLKVFPGAAGDDKEAFIPELPREDAYYKELRLFIEALRGERDIDFIGLAKSHTDTIRMAEAEIESADNMGVPVKL